MSCRQLAYGRGRGHDFHSSRDAGSFDFDGLLDEAIASRGCQRLWGADRLKTYRDGFQALKGNREACDTTVALSQTMLLADRGDLDHIAAAVRKIQAHGATLARAAR